MPLTLNQLREQLDRMKHLNISDRNWSRSHNNLFCKRTPNHLARMV